VYWLVSKAEQSAFTRLKWVENRALIGQDRVPIFNQHFRTRHRESSPNPCLYSVEQWLADKRPPDELAAAFLSY
jgi:hypothetical protein